MKIMLDRDPPDKTCTIGHLWVDSQPFCDTLEPLHPIPPGEYPVVMTLSGRAQSKKLWTPRNDFTLPEILQVPGRTAIRFHAGDTAADTEGCILVGTWSGGEYIHTSRPALEALIDLIVQSLGNEQAVTLKVSDPLL